MNQEQYQYQMKLNQPSLTPRSALNDITLHMSKQPIYIRKDTRTMITSHNSAKQIQNYATDNFRVQQTANNCGSLYQSEVSRDFQDLKNQPKPKVDKTKYKTEMCKNWIESGQCRYGNKCQFAHGNVEVINKDPTNNKYKSKACKQFHEKFHCPYGRRCLFKHEDR